MFKKVLFLIQILNLFFFAANAQKMTLPIPSPSQLRWAQAEMGVVFHYDLHVFDNKRYNQTENRINPIEDYNIFNPQKLNTDQWILAAKAAGARFALLTATHETGFALYQSDVNPYCMKALKWADGKGDIVRDFVNSCRKYGIMPGIYIGIRWNSMLGVHNFKVEGDDKFAAQRQSWYKRLCERMTQELCTRYGELFMIWFDGGADDPAGDGPDVEPIVKKYQPNCLFYHNSRRADVRWSGSESGTVGYPCYSTFPTPYSHNKDIDTLANYQNLLRQGDPHGKYWVPAMADAPLRGANGRHEWFWEPGDENAVEPLDRLVDMYYKSVGRNATLILGLTPNPDGLIPEGDVTRLKEFGSCIHDMVGRTPLYTADLKKPAIEINMKSFLPVNQIVIQEDIAHGERVRAYRIMGLTEKGWEKICSGDNIGHKRIDVFPRIKVKRIRLCIDKAIGKAEILNFSVYNSKF